MITKQEKSQSSYYSHTKTIFTGVEYFSDNFFVTLG